MHMAYSKAQRQRAIVELIRGNAVSSQDELVDRLAELRYPATQATVSRDLEQIGAVKIRRAGQLVYALAHDAGDVTGPAIDRMFREWVRSIETALNMIVIKTPPGSAHLIGVVLDQSNIPGSIGTICGDDTIFVACRSASAAESIANRFRTAAGEMAPPK
jgi:transcriptional regulator of arginine metabolism